MARKKRASASQLIERARGRARGLEKSGIYSQALEDLKLRASQQGLKSPFSQAKLTPQAKQRQLNIIRQFLKSSTSTIKGAKKERERSLKVIAKQRGYELPKERQERERFLSALEHNLGKEQGQIARDADTITELWNTLKYDLMDKYYEAVKDHVKATARGKVKKFESKASESLEHISGGDVYQLIQDIADSGGLPVDYAPKIFENLHTYLRSDSPFDYTKVYKILHEYDNGEVGDNETLF